MAVAGLRAGNREVRRIAYEAAIKSSTVHQYDFVTPYVEDLGSVIDMEAIRASGLSLGADPLGGASLALDVLDGSPAGRRIHVRYFANS